MKRTIILCITIIGICCCAMALPIDYETAQSIAIKFMGTNNVQISTTYTTDKNVAAFYVFNTTSGFVIVAADDCETPIIAYSHEGCFNPNDVPVQMEDYLQDFVTRIQYGIENNIVADETTARQWELVKATGRLNDRKDAKSVEPLLTEKWHQGCLYNSLCPSFAKVPCGHAEVGCVAVAMGQIMHYWGYPATGWGSNSYYNQGIELFADFGNTHYDWNHMPDSLTESSSNTEIETVATLLYHCGVSVNMEYGTNGSNANSANVPDALMRNFDYSRQLHRDKKGTNNTVWLAKLKDCLDLQRPIYYSGSGSAGGHAFVCDGYDDNDLLHFNWGWGGNGDGYFALGNLNPIGYSFNNNNYAIFDIYPEYEPCVVTATAYPSTAGTVEGNGEYHLGAQCTLTATPNENCEFKYWKQGDRITSYDTTITLDVEGDIDNVTACFSHLPVQQIEAIHSPDPNDPNSPYVSLSWTNEDTEWVLLKEFPINWEQGIATDGEYIYTCINHYSSGAQFIFGKYTFEGELVELIDQFDIGVMLYPTSLTYDGNYFYCNSLGSFNRIFCLDLANKTYIGETHVDNVTWDIIVFTYDSDNDGFWLVENSTPYKLIHIDRQGHWISNGPNVPHSIQGMGFITANDNNPHLLLACDDIYDYDINNNSINEHPLINLVSARGASIVKYEGKDAFFVIVGNTVQIYEIKSNLTQIIGYRIYRADDEGNTVLLADGIGGSSFIDQSWNQTIAGAYRFGISSVFANGNESEILWSDPIESTFDAIEENEGGTKISTNPSVQKVIEDGQVIIIKDGKRYNVSGQRLK